MASVALRAGFSQVVPVTLIASVVYLAPGLPLINGFVDVLSHKFLFVGLARIANAGVPVPGPGDRHCAGLYRHPVDTAERSTREPVDDSDEQSVGSVSSPQGLA